MTFFHAEPLFLKKQVRLEQKKPLLEAEKLHKTHTDVQFSGRAHAHPMAVRLQKTILAFLFREFFL